MAELGFEPHVVQLQPGPLQGRFQFASTGSGAVVPQPHTTKQLSRRCVHGGTAGGARALHVGGWRLRSTRIMALAVDHGSWPPRHGGRGSRASSTSRPRSWANAGCDDVVASPLDGLLPSLFSGLVFERTGGQLQETEREKANWGILTQREQTGVQRQQSERIPKLACQCLSHTKKGRIR